MSTQALDLSSLSPSITEHFKRQMSSKGFSGQMVVDCWKERAEVYPSRSHPGQWRITGNGLCIVGRPEGDRFIFITCYVDRVPTPLRADQMNDPKALASKRAIHN